MRFGRIDQIGIIVPHLEQAIDAYGLLLGVPFHVFEVDETNSRFSGSSKRFRIRIAVAQLGLLMVELIEPAAGTTIHADCLKNNGPGVHHVGMHVRSLTRTAGQLEKEGYTIVMEGEIPGLGKFAYFHVAELECAIEVLQLSPAWPLFLAKRAKLYVPQRRRTK